MRFQVIDYENDEVTPFETLVEAKRYVLELQGGGSRGEGLAIRDVDTWAYIYTPDQGISWVHI